MFDVWENVLEDLKKQTPESKFNTFLSKTSLISSVDGQIKIGVPNIFMQTNVPKLFDKKIIESLKKNNIPVKSTEYIIVANNNKVRKAQEVSYEDIHKLRPSKPKTIARTLITGLDSQYTMENFVTGSNNDLAASVAKLIIENPGEKKYNPFFLYGGPGLGKTHLVEAIGNEIHRNNPELKVLYVPVNEFYSEYIDATQHKKMDAFQKKYKKLDVFIIDDFQFMAKKEKSQIEFFDIFNDMYRQNKQIIITSDRLPEELEEIDKRIVSRLMAAGAYDIQMPSFEDRCAILKSRAEFDDFMIEDEAVEYIAENTKATVRDLIGDYNRLRVMSDVRKMTPLEIIQGGYIETKHNRINKTVTPRRIVGKVAKYYDLSVAEMCGKSRVAHIKTARQVAMYLLSNELHLSTTKIAREVGVKDHTTVMHGVRKITSDIKLDFSLRDQISEIKEKIYA